MLRGWRRSWGAMVVAVALAATWSWPASALTPMPNREKRLALVIGNAGYPSTPLPTSANDAGLVAQALAQAGFTVTAASEVDAADMRKMFDEFLAEAKAAGPDVVTFVYLSGYGLQYDGDTYFVPVDAAPMLETDVPTMTVRLTQFVHDVEATPAKARIFVDDLARADPFVRRGEPLAPGLTLIEAPKGSLHAENAAPTTVAVQNVAPFGFYARALAEMLRTPGVPMSLLFDRVRLRVATLTNGAMIPWDDDKLDRDITLLPPVAGARAAVPATASVSPPAVTAFWDAIGHDDLAAYETFLNAYPRDPRAARMQAMIAVRREALIWSESRRLDEPRAYWTYMRRYPRGPHLYDARRRLAALGAALEPPPRFDITVYADVASPSPAEIAIVDHRPAVFEDPEWEVVPAPPATVMPAPREAFFDDLPPPPLAPAGVLAVPVPLPGLPDGAGASGGSIAIGRIAQPARLGHGEMVTQSSGTPGRDSVMIMSADGKMIARTVASLSRGDWTIAQTGANDALISRTTTRRDKGVITMIQTGPSGGILSKAVSREEADGALSTLVTNAGDQTIARVTANRDGIIVAIKSGSVPVLQQSFFFTPAAGVGAKPTVAPIAEAPTRPRVVDSGSTRAAALQAYGTLAMPNVRPPLPALPVMALPPPLPPQPVPPALVTPVAHKETAHVEPAHTEPARKEPAHTTPLQRVIQPKTASTKDNARPESPPRKDMRSPPARQGSPAKVTPLRLARQQQGGQRQEPRRVERPSLKAKPALTRATPHTVPVPRPAKPPRAPAPPKRQVVSKKKPGRPR